MRFPELVQTMAAGGKITAAKLHFFGFRDEPKWVWEGFGSLTTYDGQVWQGLGDVVSTDGGGYQAGIVAGNLQVNIATSVEGLPDAIVQAALNSESQVYGRRYFQAVQYFDENQAIIGEFIAIFVGVMDRMTFRQSADLRQITLNVESPLVRRRAARVQYFSDLDQRSRDATDMAFEFSSTLQNKTVSWPKY